MTMRPLPRPPEPGTFASTLRRYRTARRMSQLDLALSCGVSARHLSFLETGRARPSRDMVLQIGAALLLPLSTRNALLHAAGFAPTFPASDLESQALGPFRSVLTEMMDRHAPNPAVLCDRYWDVHDANASARALLGMLHDGEGPMNTVRMLAGSRRAAEVIANLPEVLHDLSARLQLETLEAGDDPRLRNLMETLDAALARHPVSGNAPMPRRPLVPLVLNTPRGHLRFLSAVAQFGTSEDVTVRDLRLELLFPADDTTRMAMQALNGE